MPEPFPKGTAPATDTMVCDMHYSRDGQPPDKCATVLHGPHPLKLFLMGAESASGPRLGQLAHGLFQHPPGFGAETRFPVLRSEEHTSELQSLMRISYAVFCLKKKKRQN